MLELFSGHRYLPTDKTIFPQEVRPKHRIEVCLLVC